MLNSVTPLVLVHSSMYRVTESLRMLSLYWSGPLGGVSMQEKKRTLYKGNHPCNFLISHLKFLNQYFYCAATAVQVNSLVNTSTFNQLFKKNVHFKCQLLCFKPYKWPKTTNKALKLCLSLFFQHYFIILFSHCMYNKSNISPETELFFFKHK